MPDQNTPGFLNQPLMPQSWVDSAQQAAQPGLTTSPAMARLKGFGAGALEGLRNLSSPAQLASMAMLAVPGMGGARVAGEAAEAAPLALQGLSKALPEVGEAATKLFNPAEELASSWRPWMENERAAQAAIRGSAADVNRTPIALATEAARKAATAAAMAK